MVNGCFLIPVLRAHVFLRHGVGEEGCVFALGVERRFESSALVWIGKCRLGSLGCRLQRRLRLFVLRVLRLGGIEQIHAQLLFAARTALEIERLRFVEFAPYAGKHAM